jgi:hypothetical protein
MDGSYSRSVFINCPFDSHYRNLFEAIVFAVFDCGFEPRCALDLGDGGQVRIEKIFGLIAECQFGIHDISKTELDEISGLPRFNMPLELGIFLGAKQFGSKEQKSKVCLILDRERYRYQQFISDISGQDPQAHGDDPRAAISLVRNWLRHSTPEVSMPGGEAMADRYQVFRTELPDLCQVNRLVESQLTSLDYAWLISSWQKADEIRRELHSPAVP